MKSKHHNIKHIGSLLITAGLFSLLLFSGGCNLDVGKRFDLVLIDSVVLPPTFTATVPTAIKFYGDIGPNGCHTFSHFEANSSDTTLYIKVWKYYEADEKYCPSEIPKLDGRELEAVFTVPRKYLLVIVQPDGSGLIDTITVVAAPPK